MKCRFLNESSSPVCWASRYSYRPSEFEYTEYCSVDRHKMCSFYCKRLMAEDIAAPRVEQPDRTAMRAGGGYE